MTPSFRWAVVAATLLSACNEAALSSRAGDLGKGEFRYVCVSAADAACRTSQDPAFPVNGVALGANFQVSFSGNAKDIGTAQVEAVAPAYLEGNGVAFKALKEGYAGLLARASSNGQVVDFVHVRVEAARALSLQNVRDDASAGTSREMFAGERVTYRAVPLSRDAQILAGALRYAWRSSDPSVVAVDVQSLTERATLSAGQAGAATVTADIGGTQATLDVVVK